VSRAVVVLSAAALCLALWSCQREQRRFTEIAPSSGAPTGPVVSGLHPGAAVATASGPPSGLPAPDARNPYEGNAWAVSEGKRLYSAFNCNGCHFNGGGGIGPPLMDDKWIYGGSPANIFASIVEGRPNGMPAWGGKIPAQQVWEIVAYVQSMSGQLRKDVRPGRTDDLYPGPSEAARPPEPGAKATRDSEEHGG
jgi:cytochrome c oxidase cbb3-type subunit 3